MSVSALGYAGGIYSTMPVGLAMPFTQFVWVKMGVAGPAANYAGLCIVFDQAALFREQTFRIEATTAPVLTTTQRTTGGVTVGGTAPTDLWQLCISRHISSTEHRAWIDGTASGGTISARNPTGFDTLGVALDTIGSSTNPNALLAHGGWVNRDITAQEITDLSGGGNPRTIFGADLVAYLPADDEGTWLYDPVRDLTWTNGARTYSSTNPTVDAYSESTSVVVGAGAITVQGQAPVAYIPPRRMTLDVRIL